MIKGVSKKYQIFFIFLLVFGLILFAYFMTRVKVSVIVPVYNEEQYLDECLESLKKQTLDGIEFIVIDDGSSDNSLQIMQKYAQDDKRFRIFHQDNKGVGKTRNWGMKQAKGKYIGFVDGDDFISENYFEKLFEKAEKYNAEVSVVTDFKWIIGEEMHNRPLLKHSHVQTGKMSDLLFLIGTSGQQVDKIYKKSFLEKYHIQSLEQGFVYEDEWFSTLVCLFTKSVVAVEGATYYYRQSEDSVSRKKVISDEYFRRGLQIYEKMLGLVDAHISNDNKKRGAMARLLKRIDWYLYRWREFCSKPGFVDDWYKAIREKYY